MKITEENEKLVLELYNSGKSTHKVAEETKVSQSQVRRILQKHNICTRSLKTDDNIEEHIVQEYNNGMSSEKIAEKLALNASTVCRVLKRRGVELKNAKYFNRKYQINESFLDVIDTQEKAYFLGFMYADGAVHKEAPSFKLELHVQDIDILEKFQKLLFIGEVSKIGIDRVKYRYFSIRSKRLKDKLIEHGCVPAKTFKVRLPPLSEELMPHFLRGVYDGDGCINICESGRVRVILTGYSNFLLDIKEYLASKHGISGLLRADENDRVADLIVSRNYDAQQFLEFLYTGANIYLDRKYAKYQDAMVSLKKRNAVPKGYGSTNIVSYNGQKLKGEYIAKLSAGEKDKVAEFLFEYFRRNGFPYEVIEEQEMIEDFNGLCNSSSQLVGDEIKNISNYGLKIFKNYCHHYYSVTNGKKPSFEDAFNDDEKLMKAIKNRMGYYFEETFNITGNMLRQGLRNGHIAFAASVFRPGIAKFFYEFFEAKDVLDISAGFGQRMIGACAAKGVRKYVGLDPWDKTILALGDIKDFLSFTGKDISLIQTGSEDFVTNERFDFCFSSPPFFDKEIYCQSGQAYSSGYSGFLDYWVRTAENVHKVLRGKYFVINMDQKIIVDMLVKTNKLFVLENVFKINFTRSHLPSDSADSYYILRKV